MKRYFSLSVLLLVTTTLLIESERTLLRAVYQSQPSNLFEAYEPFLPGYPLPTFRLLPCEMFLPGPSIKSSTLRCRVFPTDGVFHQIDLEVQDGTISFTALHSKHLRLGDLLLLWGKPDAIQKRACAEGFMIRIRWEQATYTIAAQVSRSRLHEVVALITFTG